MKIKSTIKSITLLIFVFVFGQTNAQTTKFKKGVEQGVISVKLSPTLATTLSQSTITTKNNKLRTGVKTLDKVLSPFSATKMERVFPSTPYNAAKLKKHGLDLWYTISIDENADPNLVVEELKKQTDINIVECNYQRVLPTTTFNEVSPPSINAQSTQPFNDPYLIYQWHYKNTNQLNFPHTNLADVNLFEAWKVTKGRSDIIVSVHDEGVDINHVDLKDNIWVNHREIPGNGIDDDGNGYIDDVNGYDFVSKTGNLPGENHGTHVAGTVSAVNNNGIGVSGVAGGTGNGDGVKIMSLRVLGVGYNVRIENSYVYAADNGAVISQNSWGYTEPNVFEQRVLDAIDYFIAEAGDYQGSPMKGGIVIFSAGNNPTEDIYYPAAYKNSISVAAIAPNWEVASYSSYGKTINISAVGGDINKFGEDGGVLSTIPNNLYAMSQGTSMAAPHVSGIAALIIANSPTQITGTEVANRLKASVTDVYKYNLPKYAGKLGTGAIDAKLAVGVKAANYPPNFINPPSVIAMKEDETREVTIRVEDPEGDNFTLETGSLPSFVKMENTGNNIKLTISNPTIGVHTMSFKATDSKGLTKHLSISIQVQIGNRPPKFMGDIEPMEFNILSPEKEINLRNLFIDPDGDEMDISYSVDRPDILEITKKRGSLILRPKAAGTANITFTATDGKTITNGVLEVIIKDCLKNAVRQKWNKVLVFDAVLTYNVETYQWYKNGLLINGANKQYYAAGGDGSENLEVGAKYYVKLTSKSEEDYSCVYLPSKNEQLALRAYPNPVKRGQSVTIETGELDVKNSPLHIEVFTLSGQSINTISSDKYETMLKMPNESGYYLIKVISKEVSKTFKVLVE